MEPLVLYTLTILMLFGVIANFLHIISPNNSIKKAIMSGRPALSDRTIVIVATIFMFIYFSLFGYLVTLL